MSRTKLNYFGLLLGLFLTFQTGFSVELITLVDRGEPYPAMVSDRGIFWIGHSRRQFNSNYRLEAYTPQGHLIDTISLSHSLSNISKTGNGSVVITGINPSTQLTEYTFAKLENSQIRSKTTQINVDGFITFWLGTIGNRQYFVDVGGNSNDTNTDLNVPAQTIFSAISSQPTYLSARVRMPLAGLVTDNNKFILISSEGISLSSGSIVEVDPDTSATRVLIASKTAKFRGIEPIPGSSDILTIASGLNKLVLLDTVKGEIQREFSTMGYSRVFKLTGRCAIVGNDENNTIEVFDLKSKESKPLITESVGLPAGEFSGIKQIAVDELTGTVFARANYPCNPFTEICDKEYNRVVSFGSTVAEKIQKLCK